MTDSDYRDIRVPQDATLEEVIEIINMTRLQIDLNHPDVKAWVFDHKDWILPKGMKP